MVQVRQGVWFLLLGALYSVPRAETVTVCESSCEFDSIKAAIASVTSGSTILLQTTQAFTETDIVVSKDVVIEGLGQYVTTLQAAQTEDSGAGRILFVLPGVQATLRNLTLRHGDADWGSAVWVDNNDESITKLTMESVSVTHNVSTNGGAIYNRGDLVVRDSVLRNNTGFRGGALYNERSALLIDSWVEGNRAERGGGIFNGGGAVITGVGLDMSINFANEAGGALYNWGRTTLRSRDPENDRAFIANNVAIHGGAIFAAAPSSTRLSGITFSGNDAAANGDTATCGGAIRSEGALDLRFVDAFENEARSLEGISDGGALCIMGGSAELYETLLRDNAAGRGGAVFMDQAALTLEHAAVTGNEASRGAGLYLLSGTMTATNATIGYNLARFSGGGIFSCNTQTTLSNVTIARNEARVGDLNTAAEREGGGIWTCGNDADTVHIVSTIIAENVANGGDYPDCRGTFGSASYSLIGSQGSLFASNKCRAAGITSGMLYDVSPDFQNYYWPEIFALNPSSAAVDAGSCSAASGDTIRYDQIFQGAPTDGNADGDEQCDIGAWETNSFAQLFVIFVDGFE